VFRTDLRSAQIHAASAASSINIPVTQMRPIGTWSSIISADVRLTAQIVSCRDEHNAHCVPVPDRRLWPSAGGTGGGLGERSSQGE